MSDVLLVKMMENLDVTTNHEFLRFSFQRNVRFLLPCRFYQIPFFGITASTSPYKQNAEMKQPFPAMSGWMARPSTVNLRTTVDASENPARKPPTERNTSIKSLCT